MTNGVSTSNMFNPRYRPQTKFAKVMFLRLSVSHSVHKGEGVPGQVHPLDRKTPLGRYTPLAGTPPGAVYAEIRATKRVVRILLECILVSQMFSSHLFP